MGNRKRIVSLFCLCTNRARNRTAIRTQIRTRVDGPLLSSHAGDCDYDSASHLFASDLVVNPELTNTGIPRGFDNTGIEMYGIQELSKQCFCPLCGY
jgi:hypothetical protein